MKKIGLRFWLILCSVLPALLVALLLGSYFNSKQQQDSEQHLRERAANIALSLAISSQQLLQQQESAAIQSLLEQAHRLNSPLVISISLFNAEGELLLTSNSQHNLSNEAFHQQTKKPNQLSYLNQQQHLLVYQPLLKTHPLREAAPGYLLLQFEQQQLLLQQQISLLHSGLLIAVVLILALCLALFLIQKLQPELHRIKRQMQQLMDGQYRVRSYPLSIREMDLLQAGVLQLAERLARLEQEMQQNIEQVTSDLQQSMEQLEIQNIQLDFAKRKALEDNRQKSDFLAKMSHELRTPLNAVIGFTRQLLKTPLSHHQSDYLHTIQKSANSLLNLVNDVLDFSRLEEGRMSINPEPFSLRDTLNDATELLAANAFDKQLELVLVFEPECPDDVIADPARINQVLMNIAGNAIKFTEHGSIVIKVDAIPLNEEQLVLHISVKDTGRGISEEKQGRLFDGIAPIEQNDQQTGSGLGLLISKRLVQAMQGNIGFESKPGEGSTFWFTIKCQRHQLSVAEPLPLELLEHKTVLYFEPQQYSREATLQLLTSWGLQVTVCATKGQLQQALNQNPHYDIGLVGRAVAINQVNDIILLVQRLKTYCEYVYLLVNTLSPNLREALLSSGASACLPKPAHMRKLAMSIAFPYTQPNELRTEATNTLLYPLKVLTVDDNEANLKLINTLLREQVQSLDSARDGAEAWQKTTQHVYDIIFMDINMPVLDGITACQRIRQSSLNEQTPIIAVTAHAMDGERARLISLGFSEFLTKPLDEKMLHYTLHEFCQIQKNSQNQQGTATEATPLIDWDLALQRAAGKPELAQEMLLLLIKSLPQSDKQIRQAITDNDQQVLLHALHKLHGACCYTGVPRLKNLLEALETQLKKGASIKLLEPELYELDDVIQMLLEADTNMPEPLIQASSITVAQA
ncbi:histidine kinase [Alishewanella longhuensis]|uniref:histidine kinase n=1 Tax=Alishewanella longhuensis TaxID=1091037 RepID=A0ABQ3KYW5_9ALTE|nr:response regulator [Alishewanella longhuensis]GHG65144.1 histidine kinase [Alishewanella longhuensis]